MGENFYRYGHRRLEKRNKGEVGAIKHVYVLQVIKNTDRSKAVILLWIF